MTVESQHNTEAARLDGGKEETGWGGDGGPATVQSSVQISGWWIGEGGMRAMTWLEWVGKGQTQPSGLCQVE